MKKLSKWTKNYDLGSTFGKNLFSHCNPILLQPFYNYASYNRLIKRSTSKRNKTDSDSHHQLEPKVNQLIALKAENQHGPSERG